MDQFTANVQRILSFIVVGGVFLLIILNGTGFITVTDTVFNKIFDAAFLIVLLFWFNRQRPSPDIVIPPGAASKSTTTTETTVVTDSDSKETSSDTKTQP